MEARKGNSSAHNEGSAFLPTQWTRVLAAKADSDDGRAALSDLCAAYYAPTIVFLIRTGWSESEAREVAHDFFARLLEGHSLQQVERRGKFRSYLLGALKHFISNNIQRERRLKRGGDAEMVPLEGAWDTWIDASATARGNAAPDAAYDRAWATALLERALAALGSDMKEEGKLEEFEQLKPWITGDCEHGAQVELAGKLGADADTVKSMVHRFRRRFRQCVKQQVLSTLADPAQVDEEMRALFAALVD